VSTWSKHYTLNRAASRIKKSQILPARRVRKRGPLVAAQKEQTGAALRCA